MMNLEQLKDYLDCAIGLEVGVLAADQVIDVMDQKIKQLRQPTPTPPGQQQPPPPTRQFSEDPTKPVLHKATILETALHPRGWQLGVSLYFSLCGVIFAGKWGFLGGVLGVLLCFAVVDLILAIPFSFKENERRQHTYNQQMDSYTKSMQIRTQRREADEARMAAWQQDCERLNTANALMQGIQFYIQYQKQVTSEELERQRQEVVRLRDELRASLDRHYASGAIIDVFRKLVAVAQFHHYLSSGLCSDLLSDDGVYRRYLNEAKTLQISDNLQQIFDDMDGYCTLQPHQPRLYSELQEVRQQRRSMEDTLTAVSRDADTATREMMHLATAMQLWQEDGKTRCQQLFNRISGVHADNHADAMTEAVLRLSHFMDTKRRMFSDYSDRYPA